ncbi:MAG TPA: DUF4870 domain-containing protein [bacterium]|nr:DUF4870 domain-containing protein [bacterium]
MRQQSERPSQSRRLLAALAYPVWVIALLILLTDLRKDPFMKRHARLALYWFLALVIVYVGMSIIALFPFLHWVVLFFPFVFPVFLVLSVYYAVLTYNEKTFSIPVVSEWVRDQ